MFLSLSWCSLVPFILERREGGRVPKTACEPITYLPPSRSVAATRGAQRNAGRARHAGSCSPQWPQGSREMGAERGGEAATKKERTESAGISRRTVANGSKLPGSRRDGPHPGKSVEWRFSTSHHFLVDSPAELREPAVSNNDFRRFPRPSSYFVGLRFLFTVNTCLAYFA